MERPWIAERALAPELARELIRGQFPELAAERVELCGAGWDNSAFLVHAAEEDHAPPSAARALFRFPRREPAVALIEHECRVLPALAPRLPVAISAPRWRGRPSARFPWPFAGYPWIPGRSAVAARCDDEARERLAEPLAAFLSALHAVRGDAARALGAPRDELRRLDVAHRAARTAERIEEAARRGLLDARERESLRATLAACPEGWTPGDATLVHGDLDARHLLLDGAGTLRGVIDWGDVHVGDPAVDLALAEGFLPPRALARFYARYGAVDDARRRVARLRVAHHAAVFVLYGTDTGDAALVDEARATIARLRR